MNAPIVVFVYGSLKKGFANHGVLVGLEAAFVGRARTSSSRTLVDLGPWPAMLAIAEGSCPVSGELYALHPSRLGALDAFEDCPTLYRRVTVRVIADDGTEHDAETYVLASSPEDARVIATGAW